MCASKFHSCPIALCIIGKVASGQDAYMVFWWPLIFLRFFSIKKAHICKVFYKSCWMIYHCIHIGYKIMSSIIFAYPVRRPCHIPDVLHYSLCEDEKKRALFAAQGAADWQAFLQHRSRELMPGQNKHMSQIPVNSLRPIDAYMRQWTNHHWFR